MSQTSADGFWYCKMGKLLEIKEILLENEIFFGALVGSDWWGEYFYAILLNIRKLRNFSTDRCYHLTSRVANKAFYFTEEERGRFVERMRRVA